MVPIPAFQQCDLAIRPNSPQLPCRLGPIWVAGVQYIICGDGEIIRLIHPRLVGVNRNVPRLHVHLQHIVIGVVRDKHISRTIEAYAVADTAAREFYEYAGFSSRCDLSDGVLPRIIDGVEISLRITGRDLSTPDVNPLTGVNSRLTNSSSFNASFSFRSITRCCPCGKMA